MTDRPLIFSAPMVRALLDGRKTQTRRVLKPQPPASMPVGGVALVPGKCGPRWCWLHGADGAPIGHCPAKWQPEDRAWVRETWQLFLAGDYPCIAYRSTEERDDYGFPISSENYLAHEPRKPGWRSPIHMPRWASRITLTITDVRVQRVQDITEADAEAEGVEPILVPPDGGGAPHIEGFRDTWTAIHGPGSWDANPWVAALTFTVKKGNVDD